MNDNVEILKLLQESAQYFQFATAILGTIFFYKYKKTGLKYFIFLIWYIVINEYIGIYYTANISTHNVIIYNIYSVINFTFFLLLYRHFIINKKHKKWILVFLLTYLIIFVINGFFENYMTNSQSLPYIIAASFVIISITLYFIQLLNSENVLHVRKNLLFWISIGLLLYFVGNIPFRILRNYYASAGENPQDYSMLFSLNLILVIIMNICFIIGFIWSNKKQLS